jgi:hypothetical protein
MSEAEEMSLDRLALERLLAGVYAWLYAVFFGLVVLDVVYAGTLRAGLGASVADGILSEISDFLLLPYALLVLAGVLALSVGWPVRGVRYLLAISLLLPAAALVIAAVFGPALEAASLGSAIRLLVCLGGSVLAMIGCVGLPTRQAAGLQP